MKQLDGKKVERQPQTRLPGGDVWISRRHFFEINDQEWWPQFLRVMVQDCLTLGWTNRFPLIQSIAPCALVARVLSAVLGARISDYVFVDFASGAGGPTPYLEKQLNAQLQQEKKENVTFVLSDISPHLSAWSAAAKKSSNLSFIPQGIDATNAPDPETLLRDVPGVQKKKVMRLFSLAFHHFDDDLAASVLENTITTSDGFWSVPGLSEDFWLKFYSIFELQSRHLSSFITVSLLWPLAMLISPYYFLYSPAHLFFTYLVPLVPFVWVYDGYISCLRTRTPDEVYDLLRQRMPAEELANWTFESGQECHTWPIGWLFWIIATKTSSGS